MLRVSRCLSRSPRNLAAFAALKTAISNHRMDVMKLWPAVCLFLFAMPTVAGVVPRSKHVWIITEENQSYEKVIGNPKMPYYNSLANKYAVAAQYYSNHHGSIASLMRIVAGQQVTTNGNTTNCFDV